MHQYAYRLAHSISIGDILGDDHKRHGARTQNASGIGLGLRHLSP